MAKEEPRARRACCMISEVLEEAGLDRARARALRRQILQGIILMCQWQLERLEASEAEATPKPKTRKGRTRRVAVE